MLIKEFSTKYNLTSDAVRYYEKEGLLEPVRQENGYRFYSETCELNIKFIIVLKNLGFTLSEIKVLLMLEKRTPSNDCNVESTILFKNKISNVKKRVEFFKTAIQALQITKDLMAQGKYTKNKDKIDAQVIEMYERFEGGIE